MRPARKESNEQRETGRVEAFSDGVFAIAITLLVLELKVPPADHHADGRGLARALLSLWPSFVAFLASFLAILIMWMNHHGLFRLVRKTNGPFLIANGFLLLTVSFVPFPTAVLAGHLAGPSATVAVAFYCGTYVLVSVAYNVLWSVGTRGDLLRPGVSASHVAKIRLAYRVGFLAYLAAISLAFWNAYAGLALSTALWALWGVLDYEDRTGGEDDQQ